MRSLQLSDSITGLNSLNDRQPLLLRRTTRTIRPNHFQLRRPRHGTHPLQAGNRLEKMRGEKDCLDVESGRVCPRDPDPLPPCGGAGGLAGAGGDVSFGCACVDGVACACCAVACDVFGSGPVGAVVGVSEVPVVVWVYGFVAACAVVLFALVEAVFPLFAEVYVLCAVAALSGGA